MSIIFKRKDPIIWIAATIVSTAVAGVLFMVLQDDSQEKIQRACMGDQAHFCREPVSFSLKCKGDEDICRTMDNRIDEDPRFYRAQKGRPDVVFRFEIYRSAADQKIAGMKVWSLSEKVIFKRPIEGTSSGPGEELKKSAVYDFDFLIEGIK